MAAILSQLLGYRMFTGELINSIITQVNNLTGNGTAGAVASTNLSQNGTLNILPQVIATAGTTQLGATAITKAKAIVTTNTTSSLHGVRLPTAVTGLQVWIANAATTFSFKIYPALNGKIGAAATNATDTVLAKNKANLYIALNTTYWAVQRGA